MNNLEPIQFILKTIRIDEFATIRNSKQKNDKVKLATGFSFGIDKDKNEITVSFRVSFETEIAPFIILQISCVFRVEPGDFKKFPIKNEVTIQVRKDFLSHLSFLTIGTARGILHAKLESTPFSEFILPILDISEVVLNDGELKETLVP